MLEARERRALSVRSTVWRNHKAPLCRECADVGQCIEGRCPPPYAVDVRYSMYFLFISFFLSFSPSTSQPDTISSPRPCLRSLYSTSAGYSSDGPRRLAIIEKGRRRLLSRCFAPLLAGKRRGKK